MSIPLNDSQQRPRFDLLGHSAACQLPVWLLMSSQEATEMHALSFCLSHDPQAIPCFFLLLVDILEVEM